MNSVLKPCPFCGGSAHVVFRGTRHSGNWKGYIIAQCQKCLASTKGFFYQGPVIEIPLEDTVGAEKAEKAWNRRVNHEQTGGKPDGETDI